MVPLSSFGGRPCRSDHHKMDDLQKELEPSRNNHLRFVFDCSCAKSDFQLHLVERYDTINSHKTDICHFLDSYVSCISLQFVHQGACRGRYPLDQALERMAACNSDNVLRALRANFVPATFVARSSKA